MCIRDSLNMVTGYGDTGAALANHLDVRVIAFTGSLETVKKIASLAKIKVERKDLKRFAQELEAIIGWIEQLKEVETKNVLPMTSVVDADLPTREDKILGTENSKEILSNSPESKENYFVVPKVVE